MKGEIAAKEPKAVEVEAGKTYMWCNCGKSSKQPFCDGSHAGSELTPMLYKPEKDQTVFLCQCKQTGNPPFCDGTHSKL